MKKKKNVTIIIPAYNPNNKLLQLVDELIKNSFSNIIVVDDGSKDECKLIFQKLPKNIKIITHDINLGKGKSLKDAIKVLDNCDGFITVDADGQHKVEDVIKVNVSLQENDIVLGVRNFKSKNVPLRSKFGNKFSSIIFKIRTGISLNDTQTGLRGINIKYKNLALETDGNRFEYEMNFLYNIAKNKIKIKTIPIETIYEDGNKGSHFNVIRDSLLIHKWILYIAILLILIILLLCLPVIK